MLTENIYYNAIETQLDMHVYTIIVQAISYIVLIKVKADESHELHNCYYNKLHTLNFRIIFKARSRNSVVNSV